MLNLYNDSLQHPIPSDVITKILARQSTACTRAATAPSPLGEVIQESWISGRAGSPQLEDLLQPVRDKIHQKWWGPQGRPLGVDPSELIKPYLQRRDCVPVRSLITHLGELLIRAWLRPVREYLQHCMSEYGSIYRNPRQVYTTLLQKDRSNSGYRHFTTTNSRNPNYIREAVILTEDMYRPDPMIQWYRDMRGKFRSIFGGSLQHLAVYETYLSNILTRGLSQHTGVFYHSEIEESYYVELWKRKQSNHILVVECDYEQMDAHCSSSLCIQVLDLVLEFCDIPPAERAPALRALSFFFNSPVIGIDGKLYTGLDNVLSGIGPTNGIENLINAVVQLISIARACEDDWTLVPSFLLRVMGDDSALLVASHRGHEWVAKFLDEFEYVSHALGLEINRLKQGVQDNIYCFCRRYYPIRPIRGYKYTTFNKTIVPIPIYPVDYALNSILRPEDETLVTRPSEAFPMTSADDVQRMCSLLDNAWGDPRTMPLLNRIAQVVDRDLLVNDLSVSTKQRDSWRRKVYGAEGWDRVTSPVVQTLLKLVNK